MKAEATDLVLMASEERMREVGKQLNCTARQCRQHLLGLAKTWPERVIDLIRGAGQQPEKL